MWKWSGAVIVVVFALSTGVSAWPPVDIPTDPHIHYFAALSTQITPDITEEMRIGFNDVARMELGSDTYFSLHPPIATVKFQPIPFRAPFLVHVKRLFQGRPTVGWIGHVRNFLFEYFEQTQEGFRCSIRLQVEDEPYFPREQRPDEIVKLARRNLHLVLEEGRWGFSQRMGLNPFDGGKYLPFTQVIAAAPLFGAVENSRPPRLQLSSGLRLATGEELLWSNERTPPLERRLHCIPYMLWAAAS